jgi:aspartyl-tRNA(Asn)/glutamyl-tRNA(Gln) amidotransferase subunit B
MITANELSSRGAKDLLPFMLENKSCDVKKTAEEKGLIQKNDPEALKAIVTEVLTENPAQVADYKSGKESMFMYFVGQCMKKSKGAGNPSLFQELLKKELGQ